jgi:hypothetical protein
MQCALEKWLARPGRMLGENEVRVVKHYIGNIPYGLRFHHVDELGVNWLIANPVRDDKAELGLALMFASVIPIYWRAVRGNLARLFAYVALLVFGSVTLAWWGFWRG